MSKKQSDQTSTETTKMLAQHNHKEVPTMTGQSVHEDSELLQAELGNHE